MDNPTTLYNYSLATRQTQINDYAYNNKMDTLFFLQILLISILIVAVFAYLARIGILSYALVIYIGVILLVINVLVLAARMAYSMNLRDPHLWNRKRFSYEATPPAAAALPPLPPTRWQGLDLSGVDVSGLCKAYKL
jgi:hypothetical protein